MKITCPDCGLAYERVPFGLEMHNREDCLEQQLARLQANINKAAKEFGSANFSYSVGLNGEKALKKGMDLIFKAAGEIT